LACNEFSQAFGVGQRWGSSLGRTHDTYNWFSH
jgi:hypothetical protein